VSGFAAFFKSSLECAPQLQILPRSNNTRRTNATNPKPPLG
jgi:hypothetical protein